MFIIKNICKNKINCNNKYAVENYFSVTCVLCEGSLGVNGENLEHSTFRFPWILNVLAIEPYDFAKVLEHFVKTEPKLPADIVKVEIPFFFPLKIRTCFFLFFFWFSFVWQRR